MSKDTKLPKLWAIPATYTVHGRLISFGETLTEALDVLNERNSEDKGVIFVTDYPDILGEPSEDILAIRVDGEMTEIDTDAECEVRIIENLDESVSNKCPEDSDVSESVRMFDNTIH